jgi:hypothetical protein
LIVVGKSGTAVVALCSLAWLPFIQIISDQLFIYLQSVSSYTAPPITILFLMGVLWKGTTSFAAMITLGCSFFFGALRFSMEIALKGEEYENIIMYTFVNMNFLHFSGVLGVFTVVSLVILSLATPKKWRHNKKEVAKYTVNFGEFIVNSFSCILPQRLKDRLVSKQLLEEEVVYVDNDPTDNDARTETDLKTGEIELQEFEMKGPPSRPPTVGDIPPPEAIAQPQNVKVELANLREITGWHRYSWIITILLLVTLFVLIIIFR